MAGQVITPTAQRLTTYTAQDDNPTRNGAITTAVNPPDLAIARGVVYCQAQIDRSHTVYTSQDDLDAVATVYYTFDDTTYGLGPYVDVENCVVGDVIVIHSTMVCRGDFTQVASIRLDSIRDFGGGSETSQDHIPGALARIPQPAGSTTPIPISVCGVLTVDVAGTTRIYVVGKTFADDISIISAYTLMATRSRAA